MSRTYIGSVNPIAVPTTTSVVTAPFDTVAANKFGEAVPGN